MAALSAARGVLPLAFSLVSLLVACEKQETSVAGASGATGGRKWVIGATIDRLDNTYFVKIKEGIESRAKELGVEVNAQDARGRDDVQLTQLESFLRQKVDAILIAAVNDDVPAIEELVQRARDQGIKVVAQSQRVKTADVYVSIRQHPYGEIGGEMGGAWIRDHLGGKAKVATVGWPDRPTIGERVQGLKDGVHQLAPAAEVVTDIAAPVPEKGHSNTEAALQQWPDLRVIVAFNDDTGLAAAAAIQARFGERASKKAMEFAVFGLDATPEALAAIRDPASPFRGTVDIDPYANGRKDVDVAVALLDGKTIADAQKTEGGQLYVPVAMKQLGEKDVAGK